MDGRFVATLALDDTWHLCLDDLVACLQKKAPPLGGEVFGLPYDGDMAGADAAYMISVGGRHFAVAYLPGAASSDRFANAAAYAVERWPDALDEVGRHTAQIVVSNIEPARSFHSAIDAAGTVTLIAGILAERGPSVGVLWPTGQVLHTPDEFSSLADALLGGYPPVDAWITIRAHVDDFASATAPKVGVSPLGMSQFCGREIEIESAPVATRQACDRVMAVAADILRNGPELADNSTIRIGESDLVRVILAERGRFSANQPAILLHAVEDETGHTVAPSEAAPSAPPLFTKRRRNKSFAR